MTVDVVHDTLRFERVLAHPPDVVFAAYADVDQRVLWSAPSDDEIVIFESHDFAVGGVDHFICGLKESPSFAGTTRYELIVDDEVIVFSERLVATNGDLLAMSLVTWAVTPDGKGATVLTITDQVTSAAGDGPIHGSRDGYNAMLDQLDAHLSTVEFGFGPAADMFRVAAGAISAEDLDRATPCAGWTVRDILDHAAAGPRFFAAVANGDLSDVAAIDIDANGIWQNALIDDLARLVAAWRDPRAWRGETAIGDLTLANSHWARIGYDELVLHGWDLASATGQRYEPSDDVLDVIEPFIEQAAAGPPVEGLWGPPVEVGPTASRFERLLALSGRDPTWSPPRCS